MILGFDHLAYNVADTDAACRELEAQGWQMRFIQRACENHPHKKPLLSRYQPEHDLAVFAHPEGWLPLEVTNHGAPMASAAPIAYGRDHISLRTSKPDEDSHFFQQGLRFRPEGELLKLSSPIPAWGCRLRVTGDACAEDYPLDASGYPCLAFLSNQLEADLAKLIALGARDAIIPFTAEVNGKALDIAMCRAPGGALIELIQVRT